MSAARYGTVRCKRMMFMCAIALGALTEPALAPPGGNGYGNGGADVPKIKLTGVVRDFEPDHPDFDVTPPEGFGQYMWNIAPHAGNRSKPVFVGGGYKVRSQAHDTDGRPICWTLCNPDIGDTPAVPGVPDSGSITSKETFKQWFRDIPGENLSTLVTVVGTLVEDGEYAGMYEVNIPRFYPIDGMLFGNDADHNNFFTIEFVAEFVYDASADYTLMFRSDDDAWVFLDDQLVADLGGVNGSAEQWIHLDRLDLVDGQTYRVRFYKADRSSASSRFHLVTNIPLTTAFVPTLLAAWD